MKIGDLIKWTDYRNSARNPVEYIGILIKKLNDTRVDQVTNEWHDLLVLCEGDYVYWTSWQCEVINESG